jgi:predicted DNA-binding helix-hairpin-helix protein
MDAIETLQLLTAQMHLEPAEDADCRYYKVEPGVVKKKEHFNISRAILPNGQNISMLKTLLTSACERNCSYCPFRSGRDFRRATFKPEEFARTFMALHRSGVTEGIFLSSGVTNGGAFSQDQLIKPAEIPRFKLGYRGYLHLKVMPGAEHAQVDRSMQLANRISINLEAPNPLRLNKLAPGKLFDEELLQPLRWADEIRQNSPNFLGWNRRWPSLVTQFVVGAVGDTDLELLSTTEYLHRNLHLGRAYYSAFTPVSDTPLSHVPAESPLREHRLYQSSYLLRDYGFNLEELPFNLGGDLPLNIDPKLAWANTHLQHSPVDINLANRQDLLKIPGIGPKSAEAILNARGAGERFHVRDLEHLRRIGVNPSRAAPYILIGGRRPVHQLILPSFEIE